MGENNDLNNPQSALIYKIRRFGVYWIFAFVADAVLLRRNSFNLAPSVSSHEVLGEKIRGLSAKATWMLRIGIDSIYFNYYERITGEVVCVR